MLCPTFVSSSPSNLLHNLADSYLMPDLYVSFTPSPKAFFHKLSFLLSTYIRSVSGCYPSRGGQTGQTSRFFSSALFHLLRKPQFFQVCFASICDCQPPIRSIGPLFTSFIRRAWVNVGSVVARGFSHQHRFDHGPPTPASNRPIKPT